MSASASSMIGFSSPAFQRRHWIYLVGALGTVIEWYDFILYGCFASVFAHLFFAGQSDGLSLLLVYVVFFISYLARPLSGLLYGYIPTMMETSALLTPQLTAHGRLCTLRCASSRLPRRELNHDRYIWAMISIGVLLGSLVVALFMHLLTQPQLFAWGWRLAYCIGGSSPLMCSQLARWSPLAPAFYFMALALLSLGALFLLRRNKLS